MRLTTVALLLAFVSAPLVAQSPAPPVADLRLDADLALWPQNAQAARGPNNIRLELIITDTYTGEPAAKTVTMLIENGRSGMVRTTNRLPSGLEVNLNVDANVEYVGTGIRARVTFEYTPAQNQEGGAIARPAQLNESLWVVLPDGEKTLVSQSADPATDRKVTVELVATRMQ